MKKLLPIFLISLLSFCTFKVVNAASIVFDPLSISMQEGVQKSVIVNISHAENEKSYGSEIYIDYDPDYLEVISIEPASEQVLDGWESFGTSFDNISGELRFSFLDIDNGYTGDLQAAKIVFNAKKVGATQVSFSVNNNTRDSWIAEYASGENLLLSTPPLGVEINGVSCSESKCDLNSDGIVNMLDLIMLIRYVFGG